MNNDLGIIETLQGQMVSLSSQVAAMRVEITALGGQTVTPDIAGTAGAAGAVELDAAGIPWDSRIHAKTQTKTAKGMWKKGKGIDPTLMTTVTAQLTAAKTTAIATSPGPAASFPAVAGATPPVAGPAVTPGPAVVNPDKIAAMTAISLLTDEFGVPYEIVVASLDTVFKVKSFDELPENQYPAAKLLFENWSSSVRVSDEEVEKIISMGAEAGQAGVTEIFSQYGVSKLADSSNEVIDGLRAALSAYRQQWDDFIDSYLIID